MNKTHKNNKLQNRLRRLVKKTKTKEGLTLNQANRLKELNDIK